MVHGFDELMNECMLILLVALEDSPPFLPPSPSLFSSFFLSSCLSHLSMTSALIFSKGEGSYVSKHVS